MKAHESSTSRIIALRLCNRICPRFAPRLRSKLACDEGATIVEMGFAIGGVAMVLFGIIQLCMALYTYHFITEAAREASRFAMVRGSQCGAVFAQSYCSPYTGLADGADGNDVSGFVNNLGYPFASKLVTSTQWQSPTLDANGYTTWTPCATRCNAPPNLVQVTVSYAYPFNVPFLKPMSFNLHSTSSMVIAQ
jgi:hypothetical protein